MNAIDKKKINKYAFGKKNPEKYTLLVLSCIFEILKKIKIRSRRALLVLNVFLKISNHLTSKI